MKKIWLVKYMPLEGMEDSRFTKNHDYQSYSNNDGMIYVEDNNHDLIWMRNEFYNAHFKAIM